MKRIMMPLICLVLAFYSLCCKSPSEPDPKDLYATISVEYERVYPITNNLWEWYEPQFIIFDMYLVKYMVKVDEYHFTFRWTVSTNYRTNDLYHEVGVDDDEIDTEEHWGSYARKITINGHTFTNIFFHDGDPNDEVVRFYVDKNGTIYEVTEE